MELLEGPGDGVDVVGGAGEAGADGVGELAVVVVGLSVDEDFADEVADGGAGIGGDGGRCGGLGQSSGQSEGCGQGEAKGEQGDGQETHCGTVSRSVRGCQRGGVGGSGRNAAWG